MIQMYWILKNTLPKLVVGVGGGGWGRALVGNLFKKGDFFVQDSIGWVC